MMLYSINVRRLIGGFIIPHPGNSRPDLTILQVGFFDGYSVASKISKTLYPCFLKARHGFHQKCHHGVGYTKASMRSSEWGKRCLSSSTKGMTRDHLLATPISHNTYYV